MRKKSTIDDIARLAGVSRTTISRVLNHKPDVDPATRERILRIIEEQPRDVAAATLGVSVATFDVVLHRAMAALKRVMVSEVAPSP